MGGEGRACPVLDTGVRRGLERVKIIMRQVISGV